MLTRPQTAPAESVRVHAHRSRGSGQPASGTCMAMAAPPLARPGLQLSWATGAGARQLGEVQSGAQPLAHKLHYRRGWPSYTPKPHSLSPPKPCDLSLLLVGGAVLFHRRGDGRRRRLSERDKPGSGLLSDRCRSCRARHGMDHEAKKPIVSKASRTSAAHGF